MKKLLVLSFLIFHQLGAQCCECVHFLDGEEAIKDGIERADLVVVGTVISKEEIKRNCTYGGIDMDIAVGHYKILVSETFKNEIHQDTVSIESDLYGGSCGFVFDVGEKYIIYAYHLVPNEVKNREEKIYSTDSCTLTKLYAEKHAEIIKKILK